MSQDDKSRGTPPVHNLKKYSARFFMQSDAPDLFDDLLLFRKKLFVDHYGWDLPVSNDRERDLFDQSSTLYCALYYQHTANNLQELVGMFRAIRTDYPYLAATVFCSLGNLKTFPTTSDCWEISRFGVLPHSKSQRHSLVNYAVMFHFAHQMHARKLIAVTDLTYERFLSSLGIRSRRYGPPHPFGKDTKGRSVELIAGEIPLSLQEGERYTKLLEKINQVEIIDASQIFRPAQISA